MNRKSFPIVGLMLAALVALAACGTGNLTESVALTATPQTESLPTTSPQTTNRIGEKIITVCLGLEPNTLFPLAAPNLAAKTVLGAINDGPIDVFSTGDQPVILKNLPSTNNQDIQVISIPVKKGMEVVDIDGDVITLDIGKVVFPSGCRDDACKVVYDGHSEILMDQMLITYSILPGVEWSDGTPMTTIDFIYAYDLARDPAAGGTGYVVDRTYSYESLDDRSLQWWGIPGYLVEEPTKILFQPMPKHQLSTYSVNELDVKTGSEILPYSWGPYVLKEWSKGNYIRLVKNQNYFKAGENLPFFEEVNFLFINSPLEAVTALISKKCDILDSSTGVDGEIGLLREMQKQELANVITSTTPFMETLDLRIGPAGLQLDQTALKDPFKNLDVRQAIGYCIDHQNIVDTVLQGQSEVPDSYVPPTHPNYSDTVNQYANDVATGNALLEAAGWVYADPKIPSTRVAKGISDVADGSLLKLRYLTTDTPQRRQVSQLVAQSLARCGVAVDLIYVEPEKFYAQTADGILFGRNFDLVQYSTGSYNRTDPCLRLTTAQIPNPQNGWYGANISGYSNADFDALCTQSINDAGQSDVSVLASASAQQIYANELPSIPLFLRMKTIASQWNLCNISLDPYSQNDLWNLENFKIGSGCQP